MTQLMDKYQQAFNHLNSINVEFDEIIRQSRMQQVAASSIDNLYLKFKEFSKDELKDIIELFTLFELRRNSSIVISDINSLCNSINKNHPIFQVKNDNHFNIFYFYTDEMQTLLNNATDYYQFEKNILNKFFPSNINVKNSLFQFFLKVLGEESDVETKNLILNTKIIDPEKIRSIFSSDLKYNELNSYLNLSNFLIIFDKLNGYKELKKVLNLFLDNDLFIQDEFYTYSKLGSSVNHKKNIECFFKYIFNNFNDNEFKERTLKLLSKYVYYFNKHEPSNIGLINNISTSISNTMKKVEDDLTHLEYLNISYFDNKFSSFNKDCMKSFDNLHCFNYELKNSFVNNKIFDDVTLSNNVVSIVDNDYDWAVTIDSKILFQINNIIMNDNYFFNHESISNLVSKWGIKDLDYLSSSGFLNHNETFLFFLESVVKELRESFFSNNLKGFNNIRLDSDNATVSFDINPNYIHSQLEISTLEPFLENIIKVCLEMKIRSLSDNINARITYQPFELIEPLTQNFIMKLDNINKAPSHIKPKLSKF